jgi:uncharacterized protein YggE
MKTKAISFVVLIAALCSPAWAQANTNTEIPNQLIVTGNAEVEATPDVATVRLGVVHQSNSAKDAQEEANRTGQAILKALGTLNVPQQQIRTTRLTIVPVYQQRSGNSNGLETPRIVGYSASNIISVTLENLALIGPVVDAGLENGANQLEGVQFGLKNDGPVREQALRRAIAEAAGKAAAMASALSVSLGLPLEVSESGVSVVPYEQPREIAYVARAATPTPVSAGQLTIQASVTIRYRIEAKP